MYIYNILAVKLSEAHTKIIMDKILIQLSQSNPCDNDRIIVDDTDCVSGFNHFTCADNTMITSPKENDSNSNTIDTKNCMEIITNSANQLYSKIDPNNTNIVDSESSTFDTSIYTQNNTLFTLPQLLDIDIDIEEYTTFSNVLTDDDINDMNDDAYKPTLSMQWHLLEYLATREGKSIGGRGSKLCLLQFFLYNFVPNSILCLYNFVLPFKYNIICTTLYFDKS
jgi:hypothetical protein